MGKKIQNIQNINELNNIQPIYLECLLMANNEVIFLGKSLGVLNEEQIKKYAFIDQKEA